MKRLPFSILIALVFGLAGCSTNAPQQTKASPATASRSWCAYQTGMASWYGGRWHRRLTANGERYDQNSLTAAHRRLPFGTRVRVTNLRNGKCCVVRINNRGPYVGRRVIDLSRAAAKLIELYHAGIGRVKLEVMK